ncbi:MAG: thioredoxin fold domain-containing protein [Planctomycetales bacterium]|nr:thioredoxin fold domain-containing protein [Planctomycetales bacterium]NIM08023.1 thioredoxin fold domain-containing protein [Planctomycetales bacterium]NIN07514.1 thioredoxin fold domain-containing protein [Planctomycetales bacterium]NIN76621.1 thioredoxin fold domain-containing protein [Planctomycetales bacterium]NIO33808.1 thioredoxin fold domain-containing protein [Planctomycetales bacterium]
MSSVNLLPVVLLAGLAGAVAEAEEIQWLQSIDQGKQIAASTQRLVLVHFWSTTCKPCSQLEKEVYSYPGIGPQIGSSFVPVKVNVDQHPAVRRQFNVEFVPTDVVLAPDGSVVAHRACPLNRFEYIAGLAQVAASYRTRATGPYANLAVHGGGTSGGTLPSGSTQVAAATPSPGSGLVSDQASSPTHHLGDRYQHLLNRSPDNAASGNNPVGSAGGSSTPQGSWSPPAGSGGPAAGVATSAGARNYTAGQNLYEPPATSGAPPAVDVAAQPNRPPTAQQASAMLPNYGASAGGSAANLQSSSTAAPPTPPVGLEGSCPVELVDNERWITGDRRWGAIHRGKLYLFGSQVSQQKFLSNPDYYSPVISGNDPVLAVDQRQVVAGKRQHGLFYDKRVFLFASEETLARFYQDPLRYAEGIRNVGLASGR